MADKIVILEDDEGNNIYPISRGVAENSIDTNAIQDGAVTSNKIDWATLDVKTATLGSSTSTVTTTSAYGYLAVPGLSLSLDGPVGAKYIVIGTTTAKTPSGGYGDVYVRIHVDGTLDASITGSVVGADKYLPVAVSSVITLTSTPQTVQIYTGGSAIGTYTVGAHSRITAIRIG